MPINKIYNTWNLRIQQLRPTERKTRLNNFIWLIIGVYQSRSVNLSRIAWKIPGSSKLLSVTRRLSRFLSNPSMDVREWYEPIARSWLEEQAKNIQQIQLIVDGTKVGFAYQLLMVSLAYRKRAIPIAWTWVDHTKGHSSPEAQLALLGYVKRLLPQGIAVLLVGDCEFGAVEVLQQLDKWQWDYVLREKSRTKVCLLERKGWFSFGSFLKKPGTWFWLGKGYLTQTEIYPVNLLGYWKIGQEEPWCLAANLPDMRIGLQANSRRMWIEKLFGDFKKHGFDLKSTMLRYADRLSRLTLAVAILYAGSVSTGTIIIKNGLRHLVDHKDRRDLSVFPIGLRFIDRLLVNSKPFRVILCSYH